MNKINHFLHWLTEPESYFSYGIIAVGTLCAMYGVVKILDKITKVGKHWEERHRH